MYSCMSQSLTLMELLSHRLSDAKDVILLYCKIHPDSQCSSAVSKLKEVDPSAVIKVRKTHTRTSMHAHI